MNDIPLVSFCVYIYIYIYIYIDYISKQKNNADEEQREEAFKEYSGTWQSHNKIFSNHENMLGKIPMPIV